MTTILTAAVFCGVFFVCWLSRDHGSYRAGRNPAQRICEDCGQEQWAYADDFDTCWWWETMHEIKNPECKCHKDVK